MKGFAFVSSSGRRWDYVHDRHIVCPNDHHFPNTLTIDETGCIQCLKLVGDSRDHGAPCAKWIFLLWVRGGGNLIVEVKESERDRLRDMASPHERIDYLGIFHAA